MVARDRKFFQAGINEYVKGMQYAADLMHGQPTLFQLGSPAAAAIAAVLAATLVNTAANTETALTYISDANYGRTMNVAVSGHPATSFVVTLFPQDYLGQPMTESFTGASGSTAVLYGKKAFFRMLKMRVVTPATNAVTVQVGTSTKLGLPYKSDLIYALENNLQVPIYKRDTPFSVNFSSADAVSGASSAIIAPFPGFVKNGFGSGTTTGTAGNNTLTASLGGTAIIGLSVPIPNNTAAFTTGNPTTPGYNANNRFLTNAPIVLLIGALASSRMLTAGLTLTPTQFTLPDLTDPGTVITADPRGLYEPLTAPNGNPIAVGLVGDMQVNAAGNGGLMGIQHYFNATGA